MSYHVHRTASHRTAKHVGRQRGVFTLTVVVAFSVVSIQLLTARSIQNTQNSGLMSENDPHALPRASQSVTYVSPTGGVAGQKNSVASGVLLGLLKSSEPQMGKSIPIYSLRARIETFRKHLRASNDVRRQWNTHFNRARDKGIVIAAGRAGAILNAFVVLHTLRRGAGCTLPVVLAYYGDSEFKNTTRAYFKAAFDDVEFLDLQQVEYPVHHVPLELSDGSRRELGYKLKIFSLYAAPFREVIFLDSDSVPLQDPASLFDTATYAEHGNIFWNDFWKEPVPLWQVLHLASANPWRAGREVLEAESGQIVFDRVRYWEVLEWLLFLNTHDSLTYRYAMGDKDTFRVAFTLAGMPERYNASPLSPALPLVDLGPQAEENTDPPVRYRCLGMLQLHPENGQPYFHHRTADSKFRVHRHPGEYLSTITHVTPPVTSDQASIMNWGSPGQSIYQATGRVAWGLHSESVMVTDCPAIAPQDGSTGRHWPIDLHKANELCSGRNSSTIELNPEPILVIRVPHSYVRQASLREVEAYNALPFQESEDS
jgi:hypothetical protein